MDAGGAEGRPADGGRGARAVGGRQLRGWRAAALGVVQGVAEVVPVSSSAQLTLLPWLLRWPAADDRTSFAAGLHAGSALGIAAALRPSAGELRDGLAAALPAAAVGALAQDVVERRLGRPGPTAALLALAGLGMALADRRASWRGATTRDRAVAGAAQVLALAPGVSRAGVTLTALRLREVERAEALRTSLVMSLPVTLGAAVLTSARRREACAVAPAVLAAGASYVTARRVHGSSRLYTGAATYRLALAAAVAVRLIKEREPS